MGWPTARRHGPCQFFILYKPYCQRYSYAIEASQICLKALRRLAEYYGRGPLQISWLAAQERIPRRFLEAILLDLRNHGLLQSQMGAGGGYLLRVESGRVNLARVIKCSIALHRAVSI